MHKSDIHYFLFILVLGTVPCGVISGDEFDDSAKLTDALLDSSTRIVGGNTADRDEYPWLVRLLYKDRYVCGGTILGDRTVITSPRCIKNDRRQRSGRFLVIAGDFDYTRVEGSEQYSSVRRIIIDNKRKIAVLKIGKPLRMTKFVQAVPLAGQRKEKMVLKKQYCFVAGLGDVSLDRDMNMPRKTNEFRPKIQPQSFCRAQRLHGYTRYELCSKQDNKGTCDGDSGSPLVCFDKRSDPYLVGIVTKGMPDCWSGLDFYARISLSKNWLRKFLS